MDDNTEMIDLTSDEDDHPRNSRHSSAIEHQSMGANRDELDHATSSRLQSLARPRASGTPHDERLKNFKEKRGLGQHLQSSPRLHRDQEDMRDYVHSSVQDSGYDDGPLASSAGRHRRDATFRPPSAMGEPIPHRPSQHFDLDIDMVNNERGPVRSNYQTPTHPSSADRDGLFVSEDEDFPMDHTPTQKRRRFDSVHGYSEQRQPSTAKKTPSSSSRSRPSTSSHPPSSDRPQAGIMGSQARRQLNGGQPLNFNTPPSSRLTNFRVVPPGSRNQAAPRISATVVTQEDLQPLFLELQSVIKTYEQATTQLLQGQQNINTLRAEIKKEQREQNEYMNKTLQEFADKNKEAFATLHERNEYLQHQIRELVENDPNRTPPHGAPYGGPAATTQPRSSGLLSGLLDLQSSQQQTAARARTQSRAPSTPGPSRGSS